MLEDDKGSLLSAIAALEGQRASLGDAVVEMATAPLRAKLAALQRPAGLQQRQVTVLFADMVGSTAMAQGLDAEDTLAVLGAALKRMADMVQAHQGRVLRFTGDGVKAVFGMDAAREDDAERAVRAGLAILQAASVQAEQARRLHGIADLAFRVGLHTGSVALGAGVEADNTAVGAAVNIAARMEQSAAPGTLRISHDTWSQVRGLFDMQEQPPLQVKGVEAPMQTYLVRAALDRSTASVERGLRGLATPMMGRDVEFQRLLQAVAQARQTRQLQALTLLGDAGLGKSRMLRELTAVLRAESAGPGACRVITLRSQPDGQLRLWGLMRSLLAAQCGVADTDSAEVARRKVIGGLSPCFDERGERQAQLIGQLSGLDFGDSPHVRGLDPRGLRDQAFNALRGYLQSLAREGALPVLAIEDLHWADDGSLDLLQHLVSHAAELPLALVMSGRPALLQRRPDWGTPQTTVPLSPLAAAQSDALAQALLRRLDTVPQKLTELIVGRAEGNPYYMEELLRRLVDDGVIVVGEPHWTVQTDRLDTVQLPSTLVGLLQARLDALPANERHAARQASIVGHVFWDDALQALDAQAPQALPALQRAAFVKAHDSSAFDGTPERQFDHHLLHQVTYDTLLKSERKQGHGAAARWLAERTQDRDAEFLAMTGEHAERAGDTVLAIDCFKRAGLRAQERFANASAVSWLRRALRLMGETEPMQRADLLHQLAQIGDVLGDRSTQAALHQEVTELLRLHPDDHRSARNLFSQALLADRLGDRAASEDLARRCFTLAEACGAMGVAAVVQAQLAWLQMSKQDYAGAAVHIETGLAWASRWADEQTRPVTEGQLLMLSGIVSSKLAQYAAARKAFMAVLARGEALGSLRLQLGASDFLAEVAGELGHWDEMSAWGERMGALAEAMGSPSGISASQQKRAEAAEGRGEFTEAIGLHEKSLPANQRIGNRVLVAHTCCRLAGLHLARGDAQAGLHWCEQSEQTYRLLSEPLESCKVSALRALCELRLGRADAARSSLERTLAQLHSELGHCAARETVIARWTCQQVMQGLGDERAAPALEQLFADVQACAAESTDAADRERLIQALPVFRDIVAAYARRAPPGASA